MLLVPNAQYSDSVWYSGAAANLASSGMYGLDGPSAWFPPGYPFFLAAIYKLVGHSEFAGKLGNVAIGVALTGFTYLLGRLLRGEVVGLLGAALIAVWPNLIFSTGILGSDLLAACGFAAAMWLGMRRDSGPGPAWVRALLLGALVGWMVLVRPVSLILLASLGLWWWLSTHSLSRAVARLRPWCWSLGSSWAPGRCATTCSSARSSPSPPMVATTSGKPTNRTPMATIRTGHSCRWTIPSIRRCATAMSSPRTARGTATPWPTCAPIRHLLVMLPAKLFWLYHTDTSGFYEGALYPPMQGPSPLAAWIAAHERLVEASTFRYYELLMALAVIGAILT